jgi:hypothetical protein
MIRPNISQVCDECSAIPVRTLTSKVSNDVINLHNHLRCVCWNFCEAKELICDFFSLDG